MLKLLTAPVSVMVQYSLPMVPGPDKINWEAQVNGRMVSFPSDSNAILLDILRD